MFNILMVVKLLSSIFQTLEQLWKPTLEIYGLEVLLSQYRDFKRIFIFLGVHKPSDSGQDGRIEDHKEQMGQV